MRGQPTRRGHERARLLGYPKLCQIVDDGGNCEHAVGIAHNYIFGATDRAALPLTIESLNRPVHEARPSLNEKTRLAKGQARACAGLL